MTAKNREFFYVLMFLCLLKPRITRMWRKFDNSKIRDNNRDNRDYHEIYVLMFLCLLDTKAAQKL